jgi:translation initiation factor 2B subunit (eIF-2B alpha/beta/delta family)
MFMVAWLRCPQVGTFNLALAAASINKPFYVVAESFKFTRCEVHTPSMGTITRGRAVLAAMISYFSINSTWTTLAKPAS